MALNVEFYKSNEWNISAAPGSGEAGGTGTDTSVGSTLGDVFPEGISDYIGQDARLRFQKIFVTNTGAATITNPRIFLNNVKHPGQIQIATGSTTDTATTPSSYPGSLSASDFIEPIGLVNATSMGVSDLAKDDSFSLWVKQSIPANLPAEVGVSTTIGIIGEVA